MNDLLTQPYIKIGKGKNALYKFTNGQKTYTEKEFKALLKNNIKETCEVKDEVEPKARKTNRKDTETEHDTD